MEPAFPVEIPYFCKRMKLRAVKEFPEHIRTWVEVKDKNSWTPSFCANAEVEMPRPVCPRQGLYFTPRANIEK